MNWNAVQPGATATIRELPPVEAPASQQTALPGRDVKNAPPDGFRQRITHAITQLGRRLSSLVSAPPSHARAPGADSLERSTRKQLVSLIDRLDSRDSDETKLGNVLDKVAEELDSKPIRFLPRRVRC
jgi:hypothetical protein